MNHIDHVHEENHASCDCGGSCSHHGEESKFGGNKVLIIRLIISVVFFAAALFAPLPELFKTIVFAAAFLIAGFDILIDALMNIVKLRFFDENLLMTLAGIAAFILGDYFEGTALMLLFRLGGLIEDHAVGNSRRSISSLMELNPDTAEVLRGSDVITVDAHEVEKGEIILLKPGSRVGLDCIISSGSTTMDTSAITGEALPRTLKPGDTAMSGFINLSTAVTAEVTARQEESTVSRILELVENASAKKAKSEKFLSKFAKIYTPAVLGAALLIACIPPLLLNADWSEWIKRALTCLVISCPCALVISVPLTYFAAIGGATKIGVLFKGSASVDAMAKLKTIVFDKTGTLTTGKFRAVSVEPEEISIDSLLMLAAHAECYSDHPLAKAIVEAYGNEVVKSLISDHQAYPGLGVAVMVKDMFVCCGNQEFMKSINVETGDSSDDESVVYVAVNMRYAGRILLSDTLKEDSSAAVFQLQSMGIERVIMLSGDREHSARKAANALGISEYRAECLPQDKSDYLEKVLLNKKGGGTVAYVGDGINDAPVLAMADIGISMGSLGTDSAIEASDIVIMNDAPSRIADAVTIARNAETIVKQNIIFSLLIKLVILALGAAGIAPLWLAVIADVGVSLIATLNAMRARLTL